MRIPKDLALFHTLALIFGLIATLLAAKSLGNSRAWNQCAPTLNVNHCPWQPPADVRMCKVVRVQMDSYVLSRLQQIRRDAPEELIGVMTLSLTVMLAVLTFIVYFCLPLNAQLCLGKVANLSFCLTYVLGEWYNAQAMLHYNRKSIGAYKEILCDLTSDTPLGAMGDDRTIKCFRGYRFCQDPILGFVGIGFAGIAFIFHALAFISAVWDCNNQVEAQDWGTNDNLPREILAIRPDPPKYIL